MKTCTLRLLFLFVLFISFQARSQVKIGDNAKTMNPNSLLELESSTKGLLLPRLTNDQIKAMTNVPSGMLLFSITDSALYVRRDTGWAVLGLATKSADSTWTRKGSSLVTAGGIAKVGVGTTTPYGQFANTDVNILGSDGNGGNANSLAWATNLGGYAGMFYNGNTESGNAHNGLAVKVASNDGVAFNVSQGTQTVAGPSLFTVRGNGDVAYSGTLNMGLIIDSASSVLIANQLAAEFVHSCPTGTAMVGGGGGVRFGDVTAANVTLAASGPYPTKPNVWRLLMNNRNNVAVPIVIYTYCAKVK